MPVQVSVSKNFYDTTLKGALAEQGVASAADLVRKTVEAIRLKGGKSAHIIELENNRTRVPSKKTLAIYESEKSTGHTGSVTPKQINIDDADAQYLRDQFRYGSNTALVTYLVEAFIRERYFDPRNLASPDEYIEYKQAQNQKNQQKNPRVQPQVVARVNRDLELLLLTIQEYGLSATEIKTVLSVGEIEVTFPYYVTPFKEAIDKIRVGSGVDDLKYVSRLEIAKCICLSPELFAARLASAMESRRKPKIAALEKESRQIELHITKEPQGDDGLNPKIINQEDFYKLAVKNPDQRAVEILATILHDVNYSRNNDSLMERSAKQAQLEQEVEFLLETPLSSNISRKEIDATFKKIKCKAAIGALLKIKPPAYLNSAQYVQGSNILKRMYFDIIEGRYGDVAANAIALFENIPTNDNFPNTLKKFSDVSQSIAAACLAQSTKPEKDIAIDVISRQIRSKLNEGNA